MNTLGHSGSASRMQRRFVRLTLAATTWLALFATEALAASGGRWTPSSNWGNTAVQMVLLPGDGHPYHSRILWWSEDTPAFEGGQWGWRAGNSNYDCSSYPDTSYLKSIDGLVAPTSNIFCAGFVQLPDSRLLVIGGTEPGTENGTQNANIFTPGAGLAFGTWTPESSMADRRWYPTGTVMSDGTILATSGQKYPQFDFFGGLKNGEGSPSDSSVGRYGAAGTGIVGSSLVPPSPDPSHWPTPRLGHTAVPVPDFGLRMVVYGGRDAKGKLLHDVKWLYRDDYTVGPDYHYRWEDVTPSSGPDQRSYHSAIMHDDTMVVYGGIAQNQNGPEYVASDVWSYHRYGTPLTWHWDQVNTRGSAPAARFGHMAIYDRDRDRMLVFGGVSDTTQGPQDSGVWALQFDPNSPTLATWKPVTVNTASTPGPRYGHMVSDVAEAKNFTVGGQNYTNVKSVVVFGGRGQGSTPLNDVWRLLLLPDSSVSWMQVPVTAGASGAPLPRAWASGAFENGTERLYLSGGDASVANDTMWVAAIDPSIASPTWQPFAARLAHFSGQKAYLDYPTRNRVPEAYSVSSNTWTPYSNATLLEQLFPLTFVLPGTGKAFFAGPAETSMVFDPSSGTWSSTTYPTNGLYCATASMYRPGKVLSCGYFSNSDPGATADTTTKVIDFTSGSPSWQTSGNMFKGRFNANLTLLPNGKVLVTGGTRIDNHNVNLDPARRPEMWDPNANGGAGAWSGGDSTRTDSLAASGVPRGYHSSALLLPDARVLCAGGNDFQTRLASGVSDSSSFLGDIYCPPYLFDQNGNLATRPTVTSPPIAHVAWNRVFTISTSSSATIQSVCLIKPGASTHGTDMDQRYVTLTFTRATSPSRLLVSAPGDSTYAPPGDYLLFMVDSTGVPSVATWLKLDRLRGRDSSDVTAPGAIVDLSACADGPHTAELSWTVPWDDGSVSGSGGPVEYDIRRSYSHITDANWASATPVHPTPAAPITPNTVDGMTVDQLIVNQGYYFRMKTMDDNNNWSALSNEVNVVTPYHYSDCGGMSGGSGGGGGGFSAGRASSFSSTQLGGQSQFTENSVLDGLSAGGEGTDVLHLTQPPTSATGSYQVRLRTQGTRRFALDRARLLVCDHDPTMSAYWAGDSVALGTRSPASSARASDSTDVAALLASGSTYTAAAGTTVDVNLGGTAGPVTMILEAGSGTIGGAADSSGVLVEAQGAGGAWQVVAHVHPRRDDSELAIPGLPAGPLRLMFLTDQTASFIGRLVPAATPAQVQSAGLGGAAMTATPDQKQALLGADSLTTAMAGADTLQLSFAVLPSASGLSRDYFLALDASIPAASGATALHSQQTADAVPLTFALEQNRPNPFSQRTTIRFQLPVGEMVKLDLFDAQGRRIRTLASHYFPAGAHSLEWDHTAENGRSAGPGVYFYRIEAGPFRDRKKMVLIGG